MDNIVSLLDYKNRQNKKKQYTQPSLQERIDRMKESCTALHKLTQDLKTLDKETDNNEF